MDNRKNITGPAINMAIQEAPTRRALCTNHHMERLHHHRSHFQVCPQQKAQHQMVNLGTTLQPHQRMLHQRMPIYMENGLKNIRCTNVVFGTF
jgi:hypothetical protein